MITATPKKNKFHDRSSESLIPLETMAAAVKQMQAQDRNGGYQVMIICYAQTFESDAFQSKLACVVQAEGV